MKKILCKHWALCLTLIALFISDAFNLLGKIGIYLNYDAWNVIAVLMIAFITYSLIDERNENRKNNQERISLTLLQRSYNEVNEYTKIIASDLFLKLVPKRFPGNELLGKNSSYQKLISAPFIYDEQIFNFANKGIISDSQLNQYMDVKESYYKFVTNFITFPDVDEIKTSVKADVQSKIIKAKQGIEKCQQ